MRRLRNAGSGSSAAIFSRAVRFGVERVGVEARGERGAPAGLAVGDVARHLALVARARAPAGGAGDDRLDAPAALAGDELLVLLGQAPPGAEEGGLHRRPAHPELLADLAVAQAFELAHDEDLVVGLGEPAEGAAQVVERHARVDRGLGRRALAHEVQALAAVVGVVGDLLGALGAPEGVDARVLGDLVDPRLEGDRGLGGAHAPQGGHEHVLRDVLGAAVVVDHPVDVGPDPPLIAVVELLEGMVVARADGRHQRLVGGLGRNAWRCWCDG